MLFVRNSNKLQQDLHFTNTRGQVLERLQLERMGSKPILPAVPPLAGTRWVPGAVQSKVETCTGISPSTLHQLNLRGLLCQVCFLGVSIPRFIFLVHSLLESKRALSTKNILQQQVLHLDQTQKMYFFLFVFSLHLTHFSEPFFFFFFYWDEIVSNHPYVPSQQHSTFFGHFSYPSRIFPFPQFCNLVYFVLTSMEGFMLLQLSFLLLRFFFFSSTFSDGEEQNCLCKEHIKSAVPRYS